MLNGIRNWFWRQTCLGGAHRLGRSSSTVHASGRDDLCRHAAPQEVVVRAINFNSHVSDVSNISVGCWQRSLQPVVTRPTLHIHRIADIFSRDLTAMRNASTPKSFHDTPVQL